MIEFMPAKIMRVMEKKVSKPVKRKALFKYDKRYADSEDSLVSLMIIRRPETRPCFVCGDSTSYADFYLFQWICCEACDLKLWTRFIDKKLEVR